MVDAPALEQTEAPRARAYDSPHRRAQAAQTRTAVLDAARTLFERDGYAGTTMKAIAERAGVSVETVYAKGSKLALLLACLDLALAGDEEPVPMLERPAFVAALAAPTPQAVVAGFTAALVEVADRAVGVVVAFEDAALADASVAPLWEAAERDRRADYRRLVTRLADAGWLRPGLSVEAATDGLWATSTPRVAHRLAALGWSREERQDWFARVVSGLLLPDPRPPHPEEPR